MSQNYFQTPPTDFKFYGEKSTFIT